MPAIRTYRVTETREVPVVAASPAEAVQMANVIFRGLDENPKIDSRGHAITGPVRVTDISATED